MPIWICEWFWKLIKELPCKEKFYSSLTDTKVTHKEYERFLNVWSKFQMNTMKDYHELHLKCDILLLVDMLDIIASRIIDYAYVIIWAHWL